MQVGGDWYDAFVLQDGRVAAVVGDVMGKGVKAAAGMGRIRNAMRALALTNPPPAAVLTGLDRVFEATEEEEQVTTLAYMVVEPGTGEGTLALAGHPPPAPGLTAGRAAALRRRARHAARLAHQPQAVPLLRSAWSHRCPVFGRTGGEPQAWAGCRTSRTLLCCDRSAT